MGLLQVVATEDFRIGIAEQPFSGGSAYDVIGAVAEDRRRHQQATQQHRVHAAASGNRTGDEQQGITRQERHDHQTGLAENYQEQDRVDPRTVVVDQQIEVNVEMQNEVQRVEIHVRHLCSLTRSGVCDDWQCGCVQPLPE
ncbi:hypothetical protein D9M71_681570 [compost metagenome]